MSTFPDIDSPRSPGGDNATSPPESGPVGVELDPHLLREKAAALTQEYRTAQPFPHLVADGLLPTALLEAARAEVEVVSEVAEMHESTNRQQVKRETSDSSQLGPYTRHLLTELNTAPFLDFLEEVTGVEGLISDPHHYLGGLHETPQGGFGTIHSDFMYYPRLDAYHRLNVLVYLNREWPESYGGQLELWSPDHQRAVRSITPAFGTVVLFETGPKTYHGLPNPIAGPPGTVRRSLASYYYTSRAPRSSRRGLRGAVRRPGDDWRVGVPTATELAHFALPRRATLALRKVKQRRKARG